MIPAWVSAVMAFLTFIVGSGLTWWFGRRQERREDKRDAASRETMMRAEQRQREEDAASAPLIEVVHLESDDESQTTLTIVNSGASPARDVFVRFDIGLAQAYFHFSPWPIALLRPGQCFKLHADARPIHYLNHYLFGAGETPLLIRWTPPRGENQQARVKVPVGLPPSPKFPVVD